MGWSVHGCGRHRSRCHSPIPVHCKLVVDPKNGMVADAADSTSRHAYNAGNRLTLITDPSSNLTTNTYDNNGNLTVTNANGTVATWAYSNIGLVSMVALESGSQTTYAYDDTGQTTGITHKKANDTIIERLTYTYDDAGNRRTVTENSGDVTTWTHDNANQLTVEQRSGQASERTTGKDTSASLTTLVSRAGDSCGF